MEIKLRQTSNEYIIPKKDIKRVMELAKEIIVREGDWDAYDNAEEIISILRGEANEK